MEEKNEVLKEFPVVQQVIIGLICVAGKMFAAYIVPKLEIPLFLGSILTVVSSFFGWVSSLVCLLVYYPLSAIVFHYQGSYLLFGLCSLLTILTVRIYFKYFTKMNIVHLIVTALLNVFLVSLSGAIIYVFILQYFNYTENYAINYLTYFFMGENISLFLSSFLSRLSVNFVDKFIAVFGGWAIYWALCKTKLFKS